MKRINSVQVHLYFLQLREWFQTEKPILQIGASAIAVGFLLSLVPFLYDVLSLTPSSLFLFHFWRPITASFMETNPILLVWNVWALHQLLHVIEPIWGFVGIAKFCVIVQLITSATISVLGLAAFALFQSIDFFYYAKINGLCAVNVAALVAVKQFLPDTVIFTTPRGRLKNTHLPLTALFLLLILYFFGLVRGTAVLQVAVGIQTSWTYLRFFQKQAVSGENGDDSEHFSWPTLFPRVTRPATIAVAAFTYRVFVACKLLRKVEHIVLPTVREEVFELDADTEAERKRQIALRELQIRLAQQHNQRSSAPPEGRSESAVQETQRPESAIDRSLDGRERIVKIPHPG